MFMTKRLSFKKILGGDAEHNTKADEVIESEPIKLKTRMSPYGLYCFLSSVSDEQKRDIVELGFGCLLSLRIDKMPSKLGRWLVEHFDTCRRAIKLASNDELRVTEEDVYLTMGFPRGCKHVEEAKKNDKGEYQQVLDEWKGQWGGALPKTHEVLTQIKNQTQGGDLFKRNFIVYVVSTLVKGHQTARVNHIILKSLVHLKEVRNLNWCEYTLDSLVSCTDKWKKQPKGSYRGPILFLMVMVFIYLFIS